MTYRMIASSAAAILAIGLSACGDEITQVEEGDGTFEVAQQDEVVEESNTETPDEIPSWERHGDPSAVLGCLGSGEARQCEREFVVHEWGTFTAVQTSEGEYLEGLHHEEEALPDFVHRFADTNYYGVIPDSLLSLIQKGMPYLPEPVTQKMETPVIYFYSDDPRDVTVSVGFPEGLFSEWYPQSTMQHWTSPLMQLANGGMDWEVSLTNEPQELPRVPADDIWEPSREVPDAAFVTYGDEHEKFIFYRGVGTFEPPFKAQHHGGHEFEFSNLSFEKIPSAYFLKVEGNNGHIIPLGSIDPMDSHVFSPAPKESPLSLDQMVERAKHDIALGLIDTGLTKDEAWAMVETWAHSYFRTEGHRVLYILPDEWTDQLLPISVTPEPDRMVRTLVGRVEILTQDEEAQAVEDIEDAFHAGQQIPQMAWDGRFSEPRIRRACQLIDDEEIGQWCWTVADTIMESHLNVLEW